MKKEIADLITKQINFELFSAYLYVEIQNYYAYEGLNGFANWFGVQAKEELDHAELFRSYLLNNNEAVKFAKIDDPTQNFKNFLEPLETAYQHETEVTEKIGKIYGTAEKEGDFRTKQFLDWFVMEQGEEEKNTMDLITKYKLFGNDPKGLYMLDQELATRTYTPPSLVIG